jgi:hypothetical protein
MHSSLSVCRNSSVVAHLALILALTVLLSGWTCSVFFSWGSCQKSAVKSDITSISPNAIMRDAGSVLLTLEGSGYTRESQVLWNGNILDTNFVDPQHIQTTITQETFDLFGGSAGDQVLISVRSQGTTASMGCSNEGNSKAQVLRIQ